MVRSSDGINNKVHSAGYTSFLQQARIIVVNRTGRPVPDSSLFVAPLNVAENSLMGANFYTDNNHSKDDYLVTELGENAFQIELGTFAGDQIIVLEFATLLPTAFVVEFGGETASAKRVVSAGYCDDDKAPKVVSLPVDFFIKTDFPNSADDSLFGKVEDIVDPIGPVIFEVILDYDCGDGLERQSIPMGGSVEYCYMKINGS